MSRALIATVCGTFTLALLLPLFCCEEPAGDASTRTCSVVTRLCHAAKLTQSRLFCGPMIETVPALTTSEKKVAAPLMAVRRDMTVRSFSAVVLHDVLQPRFCNPVGTVQLRI